MKKLKWIRTDKLITVIIAVIWLQLAVHTASADSIDVAEADIRVVLTAMAAEGNFNIVLDDTVKGKISAKLSDMSPEKMVEIISQSNGYSFAKRDNIIYIGGESNDRILHSVRINYLDLDKVAQMVQLTLDKHDRKTAKNTDEKDKSPNTLQKNNGENLDVVIDRDENTVIFYATAQQYSRISQFIRATDIAPKQVSLEAKVTAIQKDAEKDLGVSWEWSKLPQSPTHDITYDTIKRRVENSDGTISEITDYVPVDDVTRSWQGGENIPGVIRFGRGPEGYPYEFYYAAQLHALISNGKANILARPNIMTIQGNEAVINIGSEVPVPTISTTDSTTTTSIEYREAGIILKCTPRVNENGIITVKVHTEVSSPMYVAEMKAYRFQKRSADTIVRLHDGETMVIGGLIGSDEAKQMSKIPFLGDIPILGNLFKHIQKTKSDTEVMIFLTAREVK